MGLFFFTSFDFQLSSNPFLILFRFFSFLSHFLLILTHFGRFGRLGTQCSPHPPPSSLLCPSTPFALPCLPPPRLPLRPSPGSFLRPTTVVQWFGRKHPTLHPAGSHCLFQPPKSTTGVQGICLISPQVLTQSTLGVVPRLTLGAWLIPTDTAPLLHRSPPPPKGHPTAPDCV